MRIHTLRWKQTEYQLKLKKRSRDSNIFIADTLSGQNCKQLESRGVKYLVLKGCKDSIDEFKQILVELDIPFAK